MSNFQKILLVLLYGGMLTVIILTWGSIGSAILTFALLLGLAMLALRKVMDSRDPDDFKWEE